MASWNLAQPGLQGSFVSLFCSFPSNFSLAHLAWKERRYPEYLFQVDYGCRCGMSLNKPLKAAKYSDSFTRVLSIPGYPAWLPFRAFGCSPNCNKLETFGRVCVLSLKSNLYLCEYLHLTLLYLGIIFRTGIWAWQNSWHPCCRCLNKNLG